MMQELAGNVRTVLDMVTYQLLTAGASSALPLHDCLPLLAATADAWTSYSTSQETDTVANATPDAGKNCIVLQASKARPMPTHHSAENFVHQLVVSDVRSKGMFSQKKLCDQSNN